jgi:hypothetical protein
MNIVTLLIVVLLVLFLAGGLGPWTAGPYWGTGWHGGGAIGLILVILLVLLLLGRI